MKTIVRKITWLPRVEHGWGNGYVVIPKGHKYHGVDYDYIPVDVHGGLTFSEMVDEYIIEDWKELTKEDIGSWMVGFDTGHCNDTIKKWPKERVIEEAEDLAKQLE